MTKEVQAARTRVCKAPRSCCPWLWKEGRGSWSGGSSHVVLKEPPASETKGRVKAGLCPPVPTARPRDRSGERGVLRAPSRLAVGGWSRGVLFPRQEAGAVESE